MSRRDQTYRDGPAAELAPPEKRAMLLGVIFGGAGYSGCALSSLSLSLAVDVGRASASSTSTSQSCDGCIGFERSNGTVGGGTRAVAGKSRGRQWMVVDIGGCRARVLAGLRPGEYVLSCVGWASCPSDAGIDLLFYKHPRDGCVLPLSARAGGIHACHPRGSKGPFGGELMLRSPRTKEHFGISTSRA